MFRFNAVLLPPDDLSVQIIQYAQSNFVGIADGYCLSDDVFPHVTLCPFQTHQEGIEEFQITEDFEIQFDAFNIRNGKSIHEGYVWLELVVNKEKWLDNLREQVLFDLKKLKYDVEHDVYSPHLTFCRTTRKKLDSIGTPAVPNTILNQSGAWRFAIGRSDVNGQFLG